MLWHLQVLYLNSSQHLSSEYWSPSSDVTFLYQVMQFLAMHANHSSTIAVYIKKSSNNSVYVSSFRSAKLLAAFLTGQTPLPVDLNITPFHGISVHFKLLSKSLAHFKLLSKHVVHFKLHSKHLVYFKLLSKYFVHFKLHSKPPVHFKLLSKPLVHFKLHSKPLVHFKLHSKPLVPMPVQSRQ